MEILAALSWDLASWTSQAVGVLGALLGLGLVIFLHELGHFAVAKWCDVNVERFCIGFGPDLWSFKWGETTYALSAFPFGGYVKMLGQDDADPSQMTNEEIAADPRSYISKTVWQRMAIISAGVIMNSITAILFYAAAFGFGSESLAPVIGDVRPGKPAWEAGIRRGDLVTHFNGREVTNFRDLGLNIAVSTGDIELRGVHDDGTPFKAKITPDLSGTRPQIGIAPSAGLELIDSDPEKQPAFADSAAAAATPPFAFGDQVLKVGGTEVRSFAHFQDLLAARGVDPVTVTVKRAGEAAPIDITVGTVPFRTLGIKLDAGPIASVQAGSPAERAGLLPSDKLAKINGRSVGLEIDPLKVPHELAALHGQEVELVITRQNPTGPREEVTLKVVPENRPGWVDPVELQGEPLAVPAIGIAMHVVRFILDVDPSGPAATAGIQPNSHIQKVELLLPASVKKDALGDKPITIDFADDDDAKAEYNWVYVFYSLQLAPQREVRLTLKEKDVAAPKVVTVVPQADDTWPIPRIGLRLKPRTVIEQARSVPEAFTMAWTNTQNTIGSIYQTLRSLLTFRLSVKELHGPMGIAQAAFVSAQSGIVPLLLFLGFLSLNLAVLNFLPIPVLDGGHMVFLLWEAITRKRPSEKVLIGATYLGLFFLLSLMALVFYLDLFVHGMLFGK